MSLTTPNFDAVGFNSVYLALNQEISDRIAGNRISRDRLEPKVLTIAPVANVDNLALNGASVVFFNGSTAFNFTGMVAPDPGKARIVTVYNQQSALITIKIGATSAVANQFVTYQGADFVLGPGGSATFMYLNSRWRQISEANAGLLITPAAAVTYTGITIGNGSISTAKYTEIGKFSIVEGGLVWGTTTVATGAFGLATLPTNNLATAAAYQVGTCMAFDSSAGQWFSGIMLTSGPTAAGFFDDARPMATFVAGTPFVWATSDQLYWRLIYQEA